MKSFFLGLAILISLNVLAQQPVKFNQTKHSFGKVKFNVPAATSFTFTNTSTKPVVIETATASCGCTTPEYPKTPIMAGKTGTIKVAFNAATVGPFNKTVTVKLANVNEPIVLTIDGEVAPAATTAKTKSAPAKKG
jgi:hypothetical protein